MNPSVDPTANAFSEAEPRGAATAVTDITVDMMSRSIRAAIFFLQFLYIVPLFCVNGDGPFVSVPLYHLIKDTRGQIQKDRPCVTPSLFRLLKKLVQQCF